MKTASITSSLVLVLALSGMSVASARTGSQDVQPIPAVVITAKRLSLQEKFKMALQDVKEAAKRLAGTGQKSTKPAGNLG